MKRMNNMKKRSIVAGLALSLSLSFTAFAGEWKQDANGWWWQNGDGSYPANSWQWLDGDNNGTAECYYFDANGYLKTNTVVDGYQVDGNGAWIANGVVQSKKSSTESKKFASFEGYSINPTLVEEMTVPLQTLVDKYGAQRDVNAEYLMGITRYKNAEDITLNSPAFEEYYAYIRVRPAHTEYNAAYDLDHDGVIGQSDELIALNMYLPTKDPKDGVLYDEMVKYLNDVYYYSLDRPICQIRTKGKVIVGPKESLTVEEAGRLVTGMGATDVQVTNVNKQEQIYTSEGDRLFVPTGRYTTVNTTRLKFTLNGLTFWVTGKNGMITQDHTWYIEQTSEPAK